MNASLVLLRVLLAAAPSQDAAPDAGTQDAPPAPAPVQQPLSPDVQRAIHLRDWIMGVAGNEAVLRSDLDVEVVRHRDLRERASRLRSQRQELQLLTDALERRLETLLKVQAGKDLGFDPKAVEDTTDSAFEREVESRGGHRETSEFLRARGLTPEHLRMQIRDELLAVSWERSIQGSAPGATGRPAVDRYVRPGWLHSAYTTFARSQRLGERRLVGIHGDRVVLQVLRIAAEDHGGKENAQRLAAELRRMHLEDGTDFAFLVRSYGAGDSRTNDGLLQPLEQEQIGQVAGRWHGEEGEALWRLAGEGQPGEVSEPLLREDEGGASWFVYRLAERLPSEEATPFADLELQRGLREHLTEALDELRVRSAFERVLDDSYVWPDDLRTFLEQRTQATR